MQIIPDVWLSERLGKPAWNVLLPEGESLTANPESNMPLMDLIGVRGLLTCKLDGGRIKEIQTILKKGFYPVAVSVTLSRSGKQPILPLRNKSVRDARKIDFPEICDIAGVAFTHDRFHQDPDIPNEIANAIKRCWAGSYHNCGVRGWDRKMIVATSCGYIVGFLAMKHLSDTHTSVLDLIGVHPSHQGQGIGRSLVDQFIVDSGSMDMEVSTQISNTASLRLYQQAGFQIVDSKYVFHLHS
jgi:ribosomal protein S18 acetylase RimI-like enzyme